MPLTPASILVVDDEPHMRRVLEIMLRQLGHHVHCAADGLQALAVLENNPVDIVLTDLRMPVLDGLGLLKAMAQRKLAIPTLVMTAHGTVETAVQAMKEGACDYLARPVDVNVLELAIARVLTREKLQIEYDYLHDEADRSAAGFIGKSASMCAVLEKIAQVGPTQAAVLITGETGTGKELAARAVHRASRRAAGLFVPINCAALPAEMIEAELFGHDKGAFTGAVKDRIGKFELACGGSIFLDEITEMPLALQAKLLRVLQEGCVERLGSNRTLQLDVRVIAACNRDPRAAVQAGLLREDLYYRLNVFALELPPLRDRPQDIADLVRHFASRQHRRVSLSDAVTACLRAYAWPGNVRELDNVVQRALVLSRGDQIEMHHLPKDLQTNSAASEPALPPIEGVDLTSSVDLDLASAQEALERRFIAEALRRTGDNKRRAAALLGIGERTLWYKLERSKDDMAKP